jgi:hypothetical protein
MRRLVTIQRCCRRRDALPRVLGPQKRPLSLSWRNAEQIFLPSGETHPILPFRPDGQVFHSTLAFWREADRLHDALQVICAVILDFDSALFFAVMQNDTGAEIFLQPRLQMLHRAGID